MILKAPKPIALRFTSARARVQLGTTSGLESLVGGRTIAPFRPRAYAGEEL
jgi:hypothetical protein